MHGKTPIVVIVALVIGFGTGFISRPIIAPGPPVVLASPASSALVEPRSIQYFSAHLDKARQIVAQCANGSSQGDECANAEQAVVEAEGRDRFKRFMGN